MTEMLFILTVELSIIIGFLLDLLFADPEKIPHPVVIIGRAIAFMEEKLMGLSGDRPEAKKAAGTVMAVIIPLTTFLVTAGILVIAWKIHPALFFLIHTIWCWQAIAVRGLGNEAVNVYRHLTPRLDIAGARRAVGRVVGRDTQHLDAEGIMKATCETVAENFSDGVVGPLFYMTIGGAPLALTYKSINTMDSMVGYKNEKYLDFGRSAALLDDMAGFLPARIGALIWILMGGLFEHRMKRSFSIWKRDRKNHASPNAAQTEAACAGALGVQLAGPAYYFGEYYDKPAIGDREREIEERDILRTCRMMYGGSVLAMLFTVACSTSMLMVAEALI